MNGHQIGGQNSWEPFGKVVPDREGKHLLAFPQQFPLLLVSLRLDIEHHLVPHYHDYLEIVLVISGHGFSEIAGHREPMVPGDLILINAKDLHTFWSDYRRPLHLAAVYFLPEFVAQVGGLTVDKEFLAPFLDRQPNFRPHLHAADADLTRVTLQIEELVQGKCRIEQMCLPDQTNILLKQKTLVLDLLLELRHLHSSSIGGAGQATQSELLRRIAPAMALARDMGKARAVSEAASLCNMSRWYFSRYFRKATGLTYTDYLLRVRIDQAKDLLRHSSLAVSSVALEVGFENLSNFNRRFKTLTGLSPRRYRTAGTQLLIPEVATP